MSRRRKATHNDETARQRKRSAPGVPTPQPQTDPTLPTVDAPVTLGATVDIPDLPRGTDVGRYIVIDRIGAGGMGTVFRAYDPELDRRVALKMLRRLDDSGENSARLLREAKAMAQLSHPNVVAVYDAGRHGNAVFLAMELIEGVTLREWLSAEERTPGQILSMFLQAGRGLAAAHDKGLVHRDFKPGNVIVGLDGRPRVLDFGLARPAVTAEMEREATPERPLPDISSGSLEAPITRVGRVVGTPRYMAPEQHLGKDVGARADQFSYCVALYEALYREMPYAGDTSDDLVRNMLSQKRRELRGRRGLPARVRKAIARGLSPDPDARFPDLHALLRQLDVRPRRIRQLAVALVTTLVAAIALTTYVATRPPSVALCQGLGDELAGSWDGTKRSELEKTFLASGKPYAMQAFRESARGLDAYAAAWTAGREGACRETRIEGTQSEQLLDLRMACLDRRRERLAALVTELASGHDPAAVDGAVEAVMALPAVSGCADKAALAAAYPPPDDPERRRLVDQAHRDLDAVAAALDAGDPRRAARLLAEPLGTAKRLDYPPLLAEALLLDGRTRVFLGDLDNGNRVLAAAAVAAASARDDELAARVWLEIMGVEGSELRHHDIGIAMASAADAAIVRAGDPARLRADWEVERGRLDLARGAYPEARKHLERGRELRLRHQAGDAAALSDVENVLGILASAEGKLDEARAAHERALALRTSALGEGHPQVAASLDNLGVILYRQGDYPGAVERYQRALAIRRVALGDNHRDVGTSENNLAGVLMDQGRLAEAKEHYERALAIWTEAVGAEHPDVALVESNLGDLALRQGDAARAAALCAHATAIESQQLGPDHPDLAYNLTCQGEALVALGKPREALPVLERALALREKHDIEPDERARTRAATAKALAAIDPPRARRLIGQALAGYREAGPHKEKDARELEAWARKRGLL